MKRFFDLVNRNLSLSKLTDVLRGNTNVSTPLITISREYGSGGSVIATRLARRLGRPWKTYHQEIVGKIASQAHLERKLIDEVDELKIPLIEEIISDFFGRRYMNLNTYSKHLVRILSTIGHRGHAVIIGRGANFLFPESLKVRVISPKADRIKVLMKYEGLSEKKAARQIEEVDHRREEFIKSVFKQNPSLAVHYDIVIQTHFGTNLDEYTAALALLARNKFKLGKKR